MFHSPFLHSHRKSASSVPRCRAVSGKGGALQNPHSPPLRDGSGVFAEERIATLAYPGQKRISHTIFGKPQKNRAKSPFFQSKSPA